MPPPPEYTTTAVNSGEAGAVRSSPPNGIYAPKATLPNGAAREDATKIRRQTSETNYSEKNGSYSKTTSRSNSPATSSSTHTTTASPAY